MYLPPLFRESDQAKIVAFMREHSFATMVSMVDGVPFATHLPLTIEERGEQIVICGHLAKPNVQWQGFDAGESLIIFGGPHAYISPSLYEKVESVPTWNYMAVHAYGTLTIFRYDDAPEKIQEMLETMIDAFESSYREQWELLSDKFREGMMRGIVGFELVVTRWEGKKKLSQNRSLVDQETVANHLLQSADPTVAAVGVAMQEQIGAKKGEAQAG